MTNEVRGEWVTISEAARRAGRSERHVRRLCQRLDPADRLMSGQGPARVRLESVLHLAQKPDSSPGQAGGNGRNTDSSPRPESGSPPAEVSPDVSAIVRAYETALEAERARCRALEEHIATLQRLLPPAPPEAPQETRPRRSWWPWGKR